MSRDFFIRFPQRNVADHVRWRVSRYMHGTHPSAHRLPRQLGCLGMGCLQIIIVVSVCALLGTCITTYLLLLAASR